MPYNNAENLLPPSLLSEVQKYIQGEQIYIPRPGDTRLGWGMKNGTRKMLERRNLKIRAMKGKGMSVDDLADHFHLSEDSIKKILYSSKKQPPAAAEGERWGSTDSVSA